MSNEFVRSWVDVSDDAAGWREAKVLVLNADELAHDHQRNLFALGDGMTAGSALSWLPEDDQRIVAHCR